MHREATEFLILSVYPPVNEFPLGDREAYVVWGGFVLKACEGILKKMNIGSVGGGGNGDGKVVSIRDA